MTGKALAAGGWLSPSSTSRPGTIPADDSGSAFGHTPQTGSFTAAHRHKQAWQAFRQHRKDCADCDPAGIPCQTYGDLL
ncbi:hypothetical protein ACFUTV_40690 [Streptomyces sp. NPDC057298]|uniref:hypothetical protein n=1 Tax=Streptomyces sp. NPDC057298 TaxID=3346091 RepID=UPI00363D4B10